jgi:hypothetical protein
MRSIDEHVHASVLWQSTVLQSARARWHPLSGNSGANQLERSAKYDNKFQSVSR